MGADDLTQQKIQTYDICGRIGNSDMVDVIRPMDPIRMGGRSDQRVIDVAQDPTLYSSTSNFAKLCSAEKLLPLKWTWDYPHVRTLKDRWSKFYFSPQQFPPPTTKECDETVFGHLRSYIENAATKGRSPVVCVGGNRSNEKRFKCKQWYRRRKPPAAALKFDAYWGRPDKNKDLQPYSKHSCTFSFVVRWDERGYYIPLLNSEIDRHRLGCGWHSCPKKSSGEKLYAQWGFSSA